MDRSARSDARLQHHRCSAARHRTRIHPRRLPTKPRLHRRSRRSHRVPHCRTVDFRRRRSSPTRHPTRSDDPSSRRRCRRAEGRTRCMLQRAAAEGSQFSRRTRNVASSYGFANQKVDAGTLALKRLLVGAVSILAGCASIERPPGSLASRTWSHKRSHIRPRSQYHPANGERPTCRTFRPGAHGRIPSAHARRLKAVTERGSYGRLARG